MAEAKYTRAELTAPSFPLIPAWDSSEFPSATTFTSLRDPSAQVKDVAVFSATVKSPNGTTRTQEFISRRVKSGEPRIGVVTMQSTATDAEGKIHILVAEQWRHAATHGLNKYKKAFGDTFASKKPGDAVVVGKLEPGEEPLTGGYRENYEEGGYTKDQFYHVDTRGDCSKIPSMTDEGTHLVMFHQAKVLEPQESFPERDDLQPGECIRRQRVAFNDLKQRLEQFSSANGYVVDGDMWMTAITWALAEEQGGSMSPSSGFEAGPRWLSEDNPSELTFDKRDPKDTQTLELHQAKFELGKTTKKKAFATQRFEEDPTMRNDFLITATNASGQPYVLVEETFEPAVYYASNSQSIILGQSITAVKSQGPEGKPRMNGVVVGFPGVDLPLDRDGDAVLQSLASHTTLSPECFTKVGSDAIGTKSPGMADLMTCLSQWTISGDVDLSNATRVETGAGSVSQQYWVPLSDLNDHLTTLGTHGVSVAHDLGTMGSTLKFHENVKAGKGWPSAFSESE